MKLLNIFPYMVNFVCLIQYFSPKQPFTGLFWGFVSVLSQETDENTLNLCKKD
jgi:hypothetical protein